MSSVTRQQSDGNQPQPCLIVSTHGGNRLAFLPDGRRVVTGSRDRTVKVWNLEDGEQEGISMEHESEITGLTVTGDGTKIIGGDKDGKIKVWDVESHELVKEWTHPEGCPEIAISPEDRLIAAGLRSVAIYTTEGRQVNNSIEVDEAVWSMCFSPDGKKLACATYDDIRVYDVNTGTLVLGPLKGHQHSVLCVLWSRDGSRLFSGSYNGEIRCWGSDTTGQQIGHAWTGHADCIRSLSLSPDGRILASASWDKTIRFWDAATGNPIRRRLQHDTPIHAVRFSPSGEFVMSLRWDGKICLWRVPWLGSVENRVRTLIRCTSGFMLTALSV